MPAHYVIVVLYDREYLLQENASGEWQDTSITTEDNNEVAYDETTPASVARSGIYNLCT